jgi:hypothetical protein
MNTVKLLGHLLKVNVAACSSIGAGFYPQLARIYRQLLDLYGFVSRLISQAVATEGLYLALYFSCLFSDSLIIFYGQVSFPQKLHEYGDIVSLRKRP